MRQYDSSMVSQPTFLADVDLHKAQQVVKWIVYTLLIINFGYYIVEDMTRAIHTLTPDSTLLDWTGEFATSIDEAAWFILLALLELETYILEDEDWEGWVAKLVHGIRLVCIVMIGHTVFAFSNTVIDYAPDVPVEGVADLCELAAQDVSFVYNLEYTEITTDNCRSLSAASAFFWIGDDPVVSDMAGLELERDLAWADLAEVIIWLIILFAIEIVVRLQEKGVTSGTWITSLNRLKTVLYLSLVGIGIYWASLGHWLYLWDELVWIGGFMAIEMNISEWRDEILQED